MIEDEDLKYALMSVLDQLLMESESAHGQMIVGDLDTNGRTTMYDGEDQGMGEGLDIKQHKEKTKPNDDDEEKNIKHN